MFSTSPDAFAMASFAAVSAMCDVLRRGQSLDWTHVEPALRGIAREINAGMETVGRSRLQADTARLMANLLGDPDPRA